MGAQQSAAAQGIKKDDLYFEKIIDTYASDYIRGSTFSDLRRLSEPQYCNKLVVITSDLLNKRLTARQVQFLHKKKSGVFNTEYKDEFVKDNLIYFRKDDLDKINVQNNQLKRNMCVGIARFYVQVAHLFSAIMNTIRPWNIDGSSGMGNLSFCDARIYGLFSKQTDIKRIQESELFRPRSSKRTVAIEPNVCSINREITAKSKTGESSSSSSSLQNVPAFATLDNLYKNVYQYAGSQIGLFVGMTPDMAKDAYSKDVQTFYKLLHGREPDRDVTSFSDIPLPNYERCKDPTFNSLMSAPIEVDKNNEVLAKYSQHIIQMVKKAREDRITLIKLLDDVFFVERLTVEETEREREKAYSKSTLFSSTSSSSSSLKQREYNIFIHPQLTETKLQNIVNVARVIIVRMYASCQRDYLEGLKLLESIIESQKQKALTNTSNAVQNTANMIRSQGQGQAPPPVSQPGAVDTSAHASPRTLSDKHDANKEYYKHQLGMSEYSDIVDEYNSIKRSLDSASIETSRKQKLIKETDDKIAEFVNSSSNNMKYQDPKIFKAFFEQERTQLSSFKQFIQRVMQ
jgi:hypothetical protein